MGAVGCVEMVSCWNVSCTYSQRILNGLHVSYAYRIVSYHTIRYVSNNCEGYRQSNPWVREVVQHGYLAEQKQGIFGEVAQFEAMQCSQALDAVEEMEQTRVQMS